MELLANKDRQLPAVRCLAQKARKRRRGRLYHNKNDSLSKNPGASRKAGESYFITFKTMSSFMLPDPAKSLVLDHCLHDHKKKYTLHSAVVMRTHVHLILTPLVNEHGIFRLAEIMNGIKGASSHSVNRLLRRKGNLWQDESMDHMIRSEEDFADKLLYIAMNAVETGVRRAEDYPWYWREGMKRSRARRRIKDPWLAGE